MAKNLLDQLFSLVSGGVAEFNTDQSSTDTAQNSATGVEKYLARQQAAQKSTLQNEATNATGVAKYLAKQSNPEKVTTATVVMEKVVTFDNTESADAVAEIATSVEKYLAKQLEKPALTGVGKYLANQALSNKDKPVLSGVERYLIKQAKSKLPLTGVQRYLIKQNQIAKSMPRISSVSKYLTKQAQLAKEKAARAAMVTGVDKYLQQKQTVQPQVEEEVSTSAPVAEVPEAATVNLATVETTPTIVPEVTESANVVESAPEVSEVAKPEAPSVIKVADSEQCQAETAKGGRCKNTRNLVQIQRTVEGQEYEFTVCKQHSTDSFKPYAVLLAK